MVLIKAEIRNICLRKRLDLSKKDVAEKSREIAKKFFAIDEVKGAKSFSLYLPVKNEVETKEIIEKLFERKKLVYLPVFEGDGYVLRQFMDWRGLEKGPYGILQPIGSGAVDSLTIDIAVFPGLVFSAAGVRLGYGKGVFDRLFAKSKALKIGLAYDFQIIDELPKEASDVKMDFVVTENRLLLNQKL